MYHQFLFSEVNPKTVKSKTVKPIPQITRPLKKKIIKWEKDLQISINRDLNETIINFKNTKNCITLILNKNENTTYTTINKKLQENIQEFKLKEDGPTTLQISNWETDISVGVNVDNNVFHAIVPTLITETLKTFKSISRIDLNHNTIITGELLIFISYSLNNRHIDALLLQACSINDETIKMLSTLLDPMKNTSFKLHVKKLNLSANKFTIEGLIPLTDALHNNDTLQTINLSYLGIEDEGAKAIAEALKVNKTLKTLNLKYNKISDEGAKAIAEALKVNTTLTTIHLNHNNIGPEGAKDLAEALKVNTTLTEMDLTYNNIKPQMLNTFQNVLSSTRTIYIGPFDKFTKGNRTYELKTSNKRSFHIVDTNKKKEIVVGIAPSLATTIFYNPPNKQ